METTNLIAIDLGASSGRLISGQFDGDTVQLKEQFRFSNHPVELNGSLYWDYLKIFQEIKYGLSMAMKDLGHLDGINIDTWGVDYGFVNKQGELLFAPHSYRDTRGEAFTTAFDETLPSPTLYAKTGNQPDKINTNMQLFADLRRHPFLREQADHVLMMPDLIGYFLTGKMHNEFTIASTSGLLDTQTREWNTEVLDQLGIPRRWFGALITGGRVLGTVLPSIAADLQLNGDIPVITGVGHDTASALLALPIAEAERANAAFISCGTWSIVGRQTAAPDVSDAAYQAGLTNEGCFDGSNRLLRNLTGLWIIQELQNEWSYKGEMVDFGRMTKEAEEAASIGAYIDSNAPLFSTPGQMEEKIKAFLTATDQHQPQTRGELVRVVIESLAMAYRQIIRNLEDVTGVPIKTINMFGGGIKNQLLVRLTADYTQKAIITGPTEATGMGNIVSQLQTLKLLTPEATTAVMAKSFAVDRTEPSAQPTLAEQYRRFQNVVSTSQALTFTGV